MMIRITILLPAACALQPSIRRLLKVFDWANSYLIKHEEKALFHLDLAGATSHVELYGLQFSVRPPYTVDDRCESDLVIIPALAGHIADALKKNQALIPWIRHQFERGAEIAGVCTGAFLLAGTHLLDEAACRKRWFVSPDFRRRFSQVNGVAENIILEEKAIRTTRGAYTFIHELLEKFASPELAVACAARFELEFNQEFQSLFSIGQKQEIPTCILAKRQAPIDLAPFAENRFSDEFDERCYPTPTSPLLARQRVRKNCSTIRALFRTATCPVET
jgi:transcriptional regulator GlxA family with amidase domain